MKYVKYENIRNIVKYVNEIKKKHVTYCMT